MCFCKLSYLRQILLLVFFGLVIACSSTQAQKGESGASSEEAQESKENTKSIEQNPNYSAIYQLALQYQDYQVAIQAMYQRIADHPDKMSLRDTLASLYYMTGAYNQCIAVSNDILSQQPQNTQALQLAALSFKNMKNYQQAVNAYLRLHKLTNSIYHLYEASFLQFKAGQYDNCMQTVNKILQNPEAENKKVTIQISESTEQTIPIKAAILNLQGAVYQKKEAFADAKESYQKALNITPDFILPQQNLSELNNPTDK